MILYDLICGSGHRFESWFSSSAAFERQSQTTRLDCPTCGSRDVAKAIMAPAIVGARPESETLRPVALLDEKAAELRALVKAFRTKVLADAQDVGTRFPEEARRMHDGIVPTRHIHGRATVAEARGLLEDGIVILPIPAPPDDLN